MKQMNRAAKIVLWCDALFSAARMLIGATSSLYLVTKGLPVDQIMYLKGFQALIILTTEIPLGYWADRRGRRWPIVLSIMAGAAWLMLTAAANEIFLLYLAELLNAISLSLVSGALTAEFIDRYQDGRQGCDNADALGDILAVASCVQFRSMALAAAAGGFLYSFSPNGLWYGAGFATLAIAIFYCAASRNFPNKNPSKKSKRVNEPRKPWTTNLWSALVTTHTGVLLPLVAASLTYTGFQIAIQYWQIFLQQADAPDDRSLIGGIIFGLAFLIILLIQGNVKKLRKLLAHNAVFSCIALTFPPALWWLVAVVHAHWLLVLLTVVLYFWLMRGVSIALDAIIGSQIPDHRRATITATRASLGRLATLASAPMVSLATAQGQTDRIVLVVLIFSIAAAIALGLSHRTASSITQQV